MLVLLDDGRGSPVAAKAGLWARADARLHVHRLDDALAHGASPDTTVALGLRARALMTMPVRRQVAAGVSRVLRAATRGSAARLPVPVCRERVRTCSAELTLLVEDLLTSGPIGVQGVAMTRMLLCDASGPLYHRAGPDDLSTKIRFAVEALRPRMVTDGMRF